MSLGNQLFYRYAEGDHCLAAVVGQSRPAVVTGENSDGTKDVLVFTNGLQDGFGQGVISKPACPMSAEPGGVWSSPAAGSTAAWRDAIAEQKAKDEAAALAKAEADALEAAKTPPAPEGGAGAPPAPAATGEGAPSSTL